MTRIARLRMIINAAARAAIAAALVIAAGCGSGGGGGGGANDQTDTAGTEPAGPTGVAPPTVDAPAQPPFAVSETEAAEAAEVAEAAGPSAGPAGVAPSTVAASADPAGDWTRFRGPGGSGVADATGLPAEWDGSGNVVWSTNLPGPGASSPIVTGDRVYVTSYSGYAESIDAPGNKEDLMRHVVCLERGSGEVVWTKDFKAEMPESDYQGGNNTRHGYATSTIASDGQRLYVFFGKSGVFALDLDGNQVWHADVGSDTHGWGSATSPALYENLVIVNASVESESLVALDKDTGNEVWRVDGIEDCWASPILVDAGGRTEVVLNVPRRLTSYDPATGQELWHCEGIDDGYLCPSVVSHDGVVFATGGRRNTTIAVRTGGSGDVTNSHVLWRQSVGSNVSSPVYVDGRLYVFNDSRGQVYCLDAETGDMVYEEQLDPRPGLVYASPTAADGKLFVPSQEGGTYVVASGPQFQQLAVNRIQGDRARVNACVTVDGNQLLLRTDQAIYCIGS